MSKGLSHAAGTEPGAGPFTVSAKFYWLVCEERTVKFDSFDFLGCQAALPQNSHLARTGRVFWFVLFRVFSGSLLLSRRTRRSTKHTKQHETRDH